MPLFYNFTDCFISLNGYWVNYKSISFINHSRTGYIYTVSYKTQRLYQQDRSTWNKLLTNSIKRSIIHHTWVTATKLCSPFPLSHPPRMSDRTMLIKTGGLISVCKSMVGMGEGAACHVETAMRSVQSMKGSRDNEETLSAWWGRSSTTPRN